MPYSLRHHMLSLGWYWASHSVRYCLERAPNGARASFLPLPNTCIVPLDQSMSLEIMWLNSDSLSPLSVNRAMIALSLSVRACSIRFWTCSLVRLGSMGLPRIGAGMPLIGLLTAYSISSQRYKVLMVLNEACRVANPLWFGGILLRNCSMSRLLALM